MNLYYQPEILLNAAILAPVAAVFAILLATRHPHVRESISIASGLVVVYCVYHLYRAHGIGTEITVRWLDIFPGVSLAFSIDSLGLIFAITAGCLWLVTTIYSIGYMRSHHETGQTRFYAFFAIAIAAALGIAFAANVFTLFVFYEILTLSTYPLVTHHGTEQARRAGRVYIGVLLSTSVLFFLPAIIGTWNLAGTMDFTHGGVFEPQIPGLITGGLLALYVIGIGKAALMPFHYWLPAAMVAPTPVSALLHAVAVVKAGAFSLLKVCTFIFGFDLLDSLPVTQILLFLAGASVLVASVIALRQDNLKLRLAYSTISQLGYITVGALMANSVAFSGGSLHIVTHAVGKITLFFCAGAILVSAHKTEISQMHGLGRQMPLTMAAFFIGSLSIIGLPPAGGTWSKWLLLTGALDGEHWILTGVLILSSLLSAAYLLPVTLRAFFSQSKHGQEHVGVREAPLPILLALGITTLCCIYLFLYPNALYEHISVNSQ